MSAAWAAMYLCLLALFAAGAVVSLRGSAVERLVALPLCAATTAAFLLVSASALDADFYLDVALVFVSLSFVGSLAFAHFLERWL